jgi:6-phospho-beta-glucosidase
MEEEDKKILKEDMVDFYTLSYYMSSCVTTHENKRIVNGNILGKVKKPYLKKSDWGWQIDPKH